MIDAKTCSISQLALFQRPSSRIKRFKRLPQLIIWNMGAAQNALHGWYHVIPLFSRPQLSVIFAELDPVLRLQVQRVGDAERVRISF